MAIREGSNVGTGITRGGSGDDPAYVIEQEGGTTVLELSSEVDHA